MIHDRVLNDNVLLSVIVLIAIILIITIIIVIIILISSSSSSRGLLRSLRSLGGIVVVTLSSRCSADEDWFNFRP